MIVRFEVTREHAVNINNSNNNNIMYFDSDNNNFNPQTLNTAKLTISPIHLRNIREVIEPLRS